MLKVIAVTDKEGTAIDRLARGHIKYNDNLDYKVLSVHPKRPSPDQLIEFEREAKDADIIDWQYFRTAEMLKNRYEWLKDKKQILSHYNPYSINEQDWNGYDLITACNKEIYKNLGRITERPLEYVPLCADTDFWTFSTEWEPNKNILMVANRIEDKKGILEVAKACKDLNLHFILVGSVSKPDYFHEVIRLGNVEFHENVTDEQLRDIYHRATIHVCNSQDNFESGTLPILESMLCGVPVLTRNVGHVPDLYNGENMVVRSGDKNDIEDIKDNLYQMISEKKRLEDIRQKAWQTAKLRSFERRAYIYQKLYRQVMYDTQTVSVVVPVYDNPEVIRKCLNAIAEQTYKNIEVVVADDTNTILEDDKREVVSDFSKYVNIPVKYIETTYSPDITDYGLGRARNESTIQATGDLIVYCDQRMIMEPDAIERFVEAMTPEKIWLYGNKGVKKEFVENFSCIKRQHIIDMGLFSERITMYGGMSQECRTRFKRQGGKTEFVENAKATPIGKSSNRNRKRSEIIKMKNRLFKMYGE